MELLADILVATQVLQHLGTDYFVKACRRKIDFVQIRDTKFQAIAGYLPISIQQFLCLVDLGGFKAYAKNTIARQGRLVSEHTITATGIQYTQRVLRGSFSKMPRHSAIPQPGV